MKIEKIVPQGFCMGVKRALAIAKKTRKEYPDNKIYVLGMLVHNRFVVKECEDLGILPLDTAHHTREECIDSLPEGSILLFTAHGTPEYLFERAKNRGLITIDATCLDVKKTDKVIRQYLAEGREILYIGKKGHPEAEAMISIDPSKIHLITQPEDADVIPASLPCAITCQTTVSFRDVEKIAEDLSGKFTDMIIHPEICSATRKRQEAVLNAPKYDAIFVIGDPLSNNTFQLSRLASLKTERVYRVESAEDITAEMLENVHSAGITAGASTPDYLIDEAIEKIRRF